MGNLWLAILLSALLARPGCCCAWAADEEPVRSACCHAEPGSAPDPAPSEPDRPCQCHEVERFLPASLAVPKAPEPDASPVGLPWPGAGPAGPVARDVRPLRGHLRGRPPSSVPLHVLHRSFRC